MNAFVFDAKAALERAQNRQTLPNLPNLPNPAPPDAPRLGGLGRLETVRGPDPEMTQEALAYDIFEERAAIREFDGGQDRETAEREAWAEARHAAGIMALDDWRKIFRSSIHSTDANDA